MKTHKTETHDDAKWQHIDRHEYDYRRTGLYTHPYTHTRIPHTRGHVGMCWVWLANGICALYDSIELICNEILVVLE